MFLAHGTGCVEGRKPRADSRIAAAVDESVLPPHLLDESEEAVLTLTIDAVTINDRTLIGLLHGFQQTDRYVGGSFQNLPRDGCKAPPLGQVALVNDCLGIAVEQEQPCRGTADDEARRAQDTRD